MTYFVVSMTDEEPSGAPHHATYAEAASALQKRMGWSAIHLAASYPRHDAAGRVRGQVWLAYATASDRRADEDRWGAVPCDHEGRPRILALQEEPRSMTVGMLRSVLAPLDASMPVSLELETDLGDTLTVGDLRSATVETRCDDVARLYLAAADGPPRDWVCDVCGTREPVVDSSQIGDSEPCIYDCQGTATVELAPAEGDHP